MRILGNSLNIQSINLYAASQSERTAAAAQRASEVRKRLLKSARSVVADPDPDASLLMGQWLDSRHSQVLSQDEYHTAASGKDPDFG
jgi:hypothetical protein